LRPAFLGSATFYEVRRLAFLRKIFLLMAQGEILCFDKIFDGSVSIFLMALGLDGRRHPTVFFKKIIEIERFVS
jgi:hypothetical protein